MFLQNYEINLLYSMWPKVLAHVKKILYNQPKPYFFKKVLCSHFWIDFNKFYTKTFRIVYILIVYLLIMFMSPYLIWCSWMRYMPVNF